MTLAANQGLNQTLTEQVKNKDAEIAALRAKYNGEFAAIKRKLGM